MDVREREMGDVMTLTVKHHGEARTVFEYSLTAGLLAGRGGLITIYPDLPQDQECRWMS